MKTKLTGSELGKQVCVTSWISKLCIWFTKAFRSGVNWVQSLKSNRIVRPSYPMILGMDSPRIRILACLFLTCVVSSVHATTYYVSPTGSDSSSGSQTAPWLTIGHAISAMSGGDTIMLNDGVYTERNGISASKDGTAASPTRILAVHPLMVTNIGGFTISQGGPGYVNWSGIVFQDGPATPNWEGMLNFYHSSSGAPLGAGYSISNCWFQGVQSPTNHNIPAINMETCTNAASCAQNFTLVNCVFTNTSQYIMSLMVSNALVANNRLDFANTHDAIHCWGAQIMISNNVITNISANPLVADHTDILQYWSDSPAVECTNVYFCHNTIVNCEAQFFQLEWRTATNYSFGKLGGLYVFNNLYINVQHHGSIDIPNVHIYNNLFYKCRMTDGTLKLLFMAGPQNPKGESQYSSICNNIFYDCGGTNTISDANAGWYDATELGTPVGFVGDYNYAVTEAGFAPKNANTWTTNGFEAHGINGGNPHFAAPDIGDYHPTANSPYVDKGTNVLATVPYDADHYARYFGAGFDMGPYEYDPGLLVKFNPATSLSAGIMTNLAGYPTQGGRMSPTNWPYQTNYNGRLGARFTVRPGHYEGSIDLGWGDYVAVTNLSPLQNLTNGTISFWAQYFQTMSNGVLWADQLRVQRIFDGGYQGYPWSAGTFFIGRGFSPVSGDNNQTVMRLYSTDPNANPTTLVSWPDRTADGSTTNWHFYTLTWNGSSAGTNLFAYLDGNLVASNAMNASFYKITNDFNWFSLGCWSHDGTPQWQDVDDYPNNGWFNGVLGEFRIYNRALSAAEVNALANNSGGGNTVVINNVQRPGPPGNLRFQ